jgi:hypothetical protein
VTDFHIPDALVQHSFDILKSHDHAKARAAYEFSEKHLKVVFARALLAAEGKTVGERESAATVSETYRTGLEAFKLVSEAYHLAKDRREAARAVIDAWRTQQSDERAMARAA